ncbi:MAG: hypothetical protein AB8G86_03275, partial [Saprospiraceae bacterium]
DSSFFIWFFNKSSDESEQAVECTANIDSPLLTEKRLLYRAEATLLKGKMDIQQFLQTVSKLRSLIFY